jgi:hypothetical protein
MHNQNYFKFINAQFNLVTTQIVLTYSLGLTNVNLTSLLTNYVPDTNQTIFTMDPLGAFAIQNELADLWGSIIGDNNIFNVQLFNVTVTNYYNTPTYLQLAPCSVFALDYKIVLDPRLFPNVSYIYELYNRVNKSIYDANIYNNLTTGTQIPSLNNTVPLNLRFPISTCKILLTLLNFESLASFFKILF